MLRFGYPEWREDSHGSNAERSVSAGPLRSAARAALLFTGRPRENMTVGDALLQRRVCRRYATDFVESPPESKIGVARNARPGDWPLNGLRHLPEGGTSGWYIWAGDTFSANPDFFELHQVSDVPDLLPLVFPYLGLPPGWRFLLAENHEDAWYDPELLPV